MTYEEFKEKVGSVILTDDGNCPVTPVVQMLQGKWKLQILYELCIKCPMRFGELKKVLKPITNTALTNALRRSWKRMNWFSVSNIMKCLCEWVLPHRERSGPAAGLLRHFPMGNEIYTMILTILISA